MIKLLRVVNNSGLPVYLNMDYVMQIKCNPLTKRFKAVDTNDKTYDIVIPEGEDFAAAFEFIYPEDCLAEDDD